LLARRLSEVLERSTTDMVARQTERVEELAQEVERVKRQAGKGEARVGEFMR
jgi:hypothetical protein